MDAFQKSSLILRDRLAVQRTHLANERTLLAYLRTAIMLGASGVTLLKLFPESPQWRIVGLSLIPTALLIAVVSIVRFVQLRCKITKDCSDEHPSEAMEE